MAGPLLVQSKSAAGTSLTLTSPTTAGNCLVVVVCDRGTLSVCTISAVKLGGSVGNFGSSAAALGGGSSAGNVATSIWVDPSCAGGQTSVTSTVTNGSDPVIFAYEFSGVTAVSPVDQTAASTTSPGSSYSSGSTATTTQASEVWLGCAYTIIATLGSPAGYTNTTQNGAGTGTGIAGYQIVTTTGTAVYNSTISAGETHSAAVLTLKGSVTVPAFPPLVTAGRTWKRRFQPELLHVFPKQPSQPVTLQGSLAMAPMAVSGQATPSYPVPPRGPGQTWLRRFSRERVHLPPIRIPQSVTSSGSLALAPMALAGTAQPVQPFPQQRPGLTWSRYHRLDRMRAPQPSQPVTSSGSMILAPMSLSGTGTESQPVAPTRPGRTWKRRFQPESLHVFPKQPSQPVTLQGSLAMAPMSLSGRATEIIIVPAQRPGLTWRRYHALGRQRPRQPSQAVTSSGSAALAPMALAIQQTLPAWVAPAFPGRTWARRFARERHQVVPQPTQPVITRGSMALAPMALAGTVTAVFIIPPGRPGLTWRRYHRLGQMTPRQPGQPVTCSGSLPLDPMRMAGTSSFSGSAGSLAMAPMALAGISSFASCSGTMALAPMSLSGRAQPVQPFPAQRPGLTWRRYHRLGRLHPAQPSQPVQSAGQLALAPMAVSALAGPLIATPPEQRPGLTWRRYHRLGRMAPPRPSQPVTLPGRLGLAPMSLAGTAAVIQPFPAQRPGLTWRRYHRLGRQRPAQPSQRFIISGSLPMAPMRPAGGPVTLAATVSGSLRLAPLAFASGTAAVNPTFWTGSGSLVLTGITGPDPASLWAVYMQKQAAEQAAEQMLREAELAGGEQILGQYYAAYKTATDAARQAYLDWAAAVKAFSLAAGRFAADNGAE